MTETPCYPDTHFLYSIPGSSLKRLRSGHDSHDDHNGLDRHDDHNNNGSNGHSKIFAPRQARNDSVFSKNLLDGSGDVIPYPWQCKPTICGGRAYLEDLHGCRKSSGWNFLIKKNLWLWP